MVIMCIGGHNGFGEQQKMKMKMKKDEINEENHEKDLKK